MSLVVMQNLNRHAVLRGEMIQGKVFPNWLSIFSLQTPSSQQLIGA